MPYFLKYNMQRRDHQYSPQYTCKMVYDLQHYIWHLEHKLQDMDLYTFHLCMQDLRDIHSLICILVDNLVDFRCSFASMSKLLARQLHDIYYKTRKEKVHTDQWVPNKLVLLLRLKLNLQNF